MNAFPQHIKHRTLLEKLPYSYVDGWSPCTIYLLSSQKMLPHPLILVLAVPLYLAAPIDKSSEHYTILTPTPLPREAKPICYRRWRRHTSHLTFRRACRSVRAREPDESFHGAPESGSDPSEQRRESEPKHVSGIILRHYHRRERT